MAFSLHHHLADFLDSFRSLLREGKMFYLSPHKPERDSRQSFSTSAAIPAMKVCAQRSLLCAVAAACFASFTFLIIAHNCILVKALSFVDLLDNIMNILKLFTVVVSDFTKSL
jgi:hypothetical protein